ncbi:hypothetical protein Clacol_003559 [Clathrus columnatus]|uniref:PLD phosphodiesterase domain-containing protein n=1 Tax=Clathrus columnatus TaxID=1419009 RepID=A0AAV5A6N9_9AGAM|nr:hypothetical protein Clacol_003559 [Clathrus columnatus]
MVSQTIIDIIQSGRTLTHEVADNPKERIGKLAEKMFADIQLDSKKERVYRSRQDYSEEDLEQAFQCGKFPYRPSDLFLMIYCDVLECLHQDPWIGLVSPSLLGSSGVIPLTIVSVIPDIMRHYRNLIANADFEVIIATNYWEVSYSSSVIHQGLIELSKRHEGKPNKPVVKLIYDRGNPKQIFQNRQTVPPEGWEEVGLPSQKEIPNVQFEVFNYHRPIMGTFHAKYMIVDRKVACLNSNNIQDRVNVEMMTHIEGPIVDSFYDMALISWGEVLNPPLPLLKGGGGAPKEGEEYAFNEDNRYLRDISLAEGAKSNRQHWGSDNKPSPLTTEPKPTMPRGEVSERHLENTLKEVPEHLPSDINHPIEKLDPNDPDPIAKQHVPVMETSGGEEVQNTDMELKAAGDKYGPAQAVANHLNAGMQQTEPTALDEVAEGFHPHILHKPHKPFPIVMVNRGPRGSLARSDLEVPQNMAWLAAFRLAQNSIFIAISQTPTFNAHPVVEEILNACRRDIDCTLYLDLGFNDGGEMLPLQGGTNSKVITEMYTTLNAEGKQGNLKVYWYTAKDQNKPIDAADKRRNCHVLSKVMTAIVKFCIIDDHVAIQGNGNQDTQSWFHSQEINIMVDSAEMCAEWRAGLESNQNTRLYGRVSDKDGLWRDEEGNIMDSKGGKGGPLAILKGLHGALARVQGKGGF